MNDEAERRITRRLIEEFETWLKERQVEPHYSVERVAELLEVTERTVHNYIELGERTAGAEGIWPTIKLSHKVLRIPASAVNRFIRARSAVPPTNEEHAA